MRFLVLGGTGATGSLFIDAAVRNGHEVVTLVRDPRRLTPREAVRAVVGNVRDAHAIASASEGADAVVSTLGVGNTRKPDGLIFEAISAVITAAGYSGAKRVVWQSALGTGETHRITSLPMRLGYHLAPRVFRDKAAGEQVLRASGLDWTLLYPGVLTNGPRTGTVRAHGLSDVTRVGGLPRISRADVVEFIFRAATDPEGRRGDLVLTAGR